MKRGRALRRRYGRASIVDTAKAAMKDMTPKQKVAFRAAIRHNVAMGEGTDMAVHLAIAEVSRTPEEWLRLGTKAQGR